MNFIRTLLSRTRRNLALAFNHAADRCIAIGLATNVSSILGEGEWQPLADYGSTDYWREEKGQWKKYTQVLTRPQAEKMVAAINRLQARQGANFRGLPIYRGHPDADPKQWPDDARYGGVMALEARENALYSRLAWNDLGKKNKEQGYYIYPSPAWLFDESEAQSRGIIAPDVLQSVGLTNTPRIPSSKPWTNSDPSPAIAGNLGGLAANDSQAAANNPLSPVGGKPTTNNQNMDLKKLLVAMLNKHHGANLADDASDEQIQTAYDAAMKAGMKGMAKNVAIVLGAETFHVTPSEGTDGAALTERMKTIAVNAAALPTVQGELDTARKSVANANTVADKFRGLAINAQLDRAIDKGRITAAERADFAKKLEADYDGTLDLLGKQTALNTKPLDPLRPNALDHSTPAGRQLAFNARIDAHMKQGCKSLDEALVQMRGNAEDAALLKAMEPAAA